VALSDKYGVLRIIFANQREDGGGRRGGHAVYQRSQPLDAFSGDRGLERSRLIGRTTQENSVMTA